MQQQPKNVQEVLEYQSGKVLEEAVCDLQVMLFAYRVLGLGLWPVGALYFNVGAMMHRDVGWRGREGGGTGGRRKIPASDCLNPRTRRSPS